MMTLRFAAIFILAGGALISCNSATEQKDAAPAPAADDETTDNDGSSSTSDTTTNEETSLGQAYYTGFDGTTDFSLLMPGFRTYTVADSSVAKVEVLDVTLSEASIAELVADAKEKDPDLDEERFKKQFSRKQKAVKITPVKAGTTTLTAARPGGNGSGSGGRGPNGGDIWGASDASVKLVITPYTTEQVAAGKARYTTEGSGTLKACKSCHESGAEDAPPHELGRIMQISDAQALQWITTGKTGSRVAKVSHAWEFSSTDEEKGIVAYVRSRQTHDVEQLTKLLFEQNLANFRGGNRRPAEE